MTYAQAKGIDLVWNTIAGRGLQAVLSAIAYKAFTQALMRIAEKDAIPYELFCVLGVFTTSRKALWPLLKATFSKLTLQTRFILIWLLISTGYLLLFPTLIDAVSGYQAIQMTWVSGAAR
jgi:RsiW-degrading membrane proteinase PrsW (M82 family)